MVRGRGGSPSERPYGHGFLGTMLHAFTVAAAVGPSRGARVHRPHSPWSCGWEHRGAPARTTSSDQPSVTVVVPVLLLGVAERQRERRLLRRLLDLHRLQHATAGRVGRL